MKLSDNAEIILQKRYYINGEDWDGLCWRVANAVGKDEASRKEYFDAINNLYFLPNSPTLMNAGTELNNLSACFKEDAMVSVENGVKEISKIHIGDKVITHKGRYRSVTEVFERDYVGDMLRINVVGCIKNRFISTPEHPIYAIKYNDILCKRHLSSKANMVCNHSKKYCKKLERHYKDDCDGVEINPGWIAAKDLVVGDYVSISLLNSEDGTSIIDMCDYLDMDVFSLDGDNIVIGNYTKNIVGRYILIDERFMRLYGYWLSDGHVTHDKKIGITFNSEKAEEYADDAIALIKDIFNYEARKEFASDGQKTIQIRVHSKIIAHFFENFSGHGFNGKFIPKIIMEQPKHLIEQLLIGQLRGDGFIFKNDVAMAYSNINLITSTSILLNKIGISNILMRDSDSKFGTTPSYRLKFSLANNKEFSRKLKSNVNIIDSNAKQFLWNDGKLFRRISEIKTETFSGIVYNLEVEDDHSYSVNGIDVHNCFVLPLDDSMDSIMDCAKSMAKVFQSGGGCGISLDKLREKDSSVGSTAGAASGVVSFMQLYDTVADTVKQGGRRRAAIICSLRVDHPEILDFINCKTDLKKFNNMNISVAITDKFMKAVEKNQDYDLVSPVNGVVGKLNAREVFMKIATNAHQSGEPGLLFIDTANKFNPIPQFGKYSTTNPCGEVFLLENEACNLLSLNLNMINKENIDYYVRLAVRFLNDVIDCGKYPLPEIHEQVLRTRKIGLGIMGWADLLASKMIPYDSPKARHLADSLSRQIHEIAHDESVMLAIKNNKYIDTTEGKRYNGTLLTIAPTGTISMIADVSSSIEPYFALCYTKNVMDGHSLKYINPILQSTLEKEGLWCSEVKAQIAKTGSIQNIDTIPQSIKDVFKTANEISVGGHVKMQAAFQKNIDNSISKSINLPNSATVEDVLHAYGLAYNLGIKGITVYRDGSRSNQVLTSPKSKIERCPECSSKEVSHESGCVTCRNCGWSKCSI